MPKREFECRKAKVASFKDAIAVALDEALTSLEESFYDLTDQQAVSYPLEGRHNIVTMVMHCLHNLDMYACMCQAGTLALRHDDKFDMWQHSPKEAQETGGLVPTVHQMQVRLAAIGKAATEILSTTTDAQLLDPTSAAPDWYRQHNRSRADTYLRTIFHTMAHVRQIWMLRGVMGLTDRDGWPEQHWA
ncbi:MAG: DinB family protein [Phycisphaerae bacterium]